MDKHIQIFWERDEYICITDKSERRGVDTKREIAVKNISIEFELSQEIKCPTREIKW